MFFSFLGDTVYGTVQYDSTLQEDSQNPNAAPPVWCIACHDNLVVTGTSDGRIEFWDGLTGNLKCIFHKIKTGATAACFIANRCVL